MLISAVQQSDSVTHIYTHSFLLGWPKSSFRFFHNMLWNELFGQSNIFFSIMIYACPSILYVIVCIYQPQTPIHPCLTALLLRDLGVKLVRLELFKFRRNFILFVSKTLFFPFTIPPLCFIFRDKQ